MIQEKIEMSEVSQMSVRQPQTSRLAWGTFRVLTRLILIAGFIAAGLFVGGFLQFANKVTEFGAGQHVENADGLVVLTGGSQRISHGLELLANKKAKRLLISGVGKSTSLKTLGNLNHKYKSLFGCCVDIEHRAADTIGNALESAKWIEASGYRSIILVTSAYHMPRALVEFRRQLSSQQIIVSAVPLDELQLEGWWSKSDTLRLMLSEYIKFLGAQLREKMQPATFSALRAGVWNG